MTFITDDVISFAKQGKIRRCQRVIDRVASSVLVVLAVVLLAGCAQQEKNQTEVTKSDQDKKQTDKKQTKSSKKQQHKPAKQPPAKLQKAIKDSLSPVLQPKTGQSKFPVVVVGVVGAKGNYVTSFGYNNEKIPAEHALFDVASLTKPVTALLLANMANDKHVELDKEATVVGGRSITWRQLATHTSGLPRVPSDRNSVKPYGSKAFKAYLEKVAIDEKQQGKFNYSTTGYALLGELMAQNQSSTFHKLINKQVINPLGMSDTRFANTSKQSSLVQGHSADGKTVETQMPTSVDAMAPSGGMYASASDYIAFMEKHLKPDEPWRSTIDIVLKPDSKIKSFPGSTMALGWQYMQAGFHWHAGHAAGHHCFMAIHRKGRVGVVILANASTSQRDTRLVFGAMGILGQMLQNDLEK